jgi:hypothetical protein
MFAAIVAFECSLARAEEAFTAHCFLQLDFWVGILPVGQLAGFDFFDLSFAIQDPAWDGIGTRS